MQTKSKLYAAIAKAIVVIIIVNMVVPNRVFAEGRALFVHTLAPPAVTKPICEVWGAGSELRVVDPSEVIKERLKRSAVLFPNFSEAWSGMGEDIYEKYSVARNVYDEAAEIIGSEDVSELFLTEEDIYSKNISQKAVATVLYSVSIYKLFSKKLEIKIEPIISSGNCIGDITAAILSDAISLKDGIRIIRSFSDFFEKVCDNVDYEILKLYNSQMSKIEPFLSDGEIELFHDTSSGSEVSSKYTYINLTVYKEKVDVDNLIEKLREAGVVEIDRFGVPVDKGMHVSAYREALREYGGNLEKIIEKIEINDPKFPIISSAKGKVLKSVEDIRNNLKDQWFEPIKWSDVINKITDEGISSFLVFGPGEQLVKTISEMSPESRVIGVTNESDIDKVTDLFFKDRGYQERWGNRYIKEIVKKALQLGLSKHTLIAQIRAYAKKNTDVIKIFSKDIDVDLIEEVFEEGTLKAFYLPIVRDDRTIYRVKCSLKPGENVLLIEPKVSREQLTRVLVSLASFAHGTNKATEVREALTWLDPTFSKIMKSVPEDEELREPVSKLYGEISYVVDTLEDLYNKVLVAVKKGEFEPENILFWWAKTESIYEKFVKCRTDFYLLKMELKNILPEERLLQLEIVALYMNKLESMLKDRLFLMRGGIPDTVISINEVLDQFYENFMQPVVKFKDSGVHSPEVPRIANMVKIDIPEGLIRVRGNERSLISLICNIAANGYKYAFNYRGINAKVDIWTERKNGQLLIKIKDNGKGMTSGELKELETCFYTTEGTGIGLTEARLIAKDHGGSIEVETMLRKGTTFILRLPIVRDEKTINVPKERKEAIKRIVRSIIGFKSDEFDALIPRLVNFTKKLTRMQVEMRGKDGFTELNERQVLNAILREANIYCLHVKQLYEKALRYQEKEGIGKTKVFEWKANVVALSRQFNGFVDRYDKFCGRDEFQEFLAKEDEFETILADIDRSIVEVKAECKNVIASMDDSVMDDAIGEREVRILAGLAGFLHGTSSMLSTAHVDIFHVYFSILKRGFSEDKKHRALNFWAGKCSRKSRQMRDLVYRVSRSSMKAIVQKRFDVSVIQRDMYLFEQGYSCFEELEILYRSLSEDDTRILNNLLRKNPHAYSYEDMEQNFRNMRAIFEDRMAFIAEDSSSYNVFAINEVFKDFSKKILMVKPKSYKINCPEKEIFMKGSVLSITSLFCDIVNNSYKYGKNGTGNVRINVDVKEENGRVIVTVIDNGPGMSGEQIEKLGKKFYNTNGTGIGLTGAKFIVKDHGGIMDVRSEQGKGTTFTISFPVVEELNGETINGEQRSHISYIVKDPVEKRKQGLEFLDTRKKYADIFSDIIELISSKDVDRPIIFALGTSWIKGYKEGELQYMALNPLITEMREFCDKKGINFIETGDDLLIGVINAEREKFRGQRPKIVVLAGEKTVLKEMKPLVGAENVFLFGVANDQENIESYIKLMQMSVLALNRAFGIGLDLESEDIIVKKSDEGSNVYIFIHKAVPMPYDDLKRAYAVQIFA